MSTALYRRYRPDTFAEVIGQEHVTEPLMAALGRGRINHAYLFSGPRGCGKTTSARILARCLNCEKGPIGVPCGECRSCLDLATGGPGSLDVVEIDAASHNGVDDARDIRDRAVFAPARDRYKIFILDEAHMVTTQGFNALLKLVEEPPEHVKFVFATTEPDKVIGTIRSRTHHYPFRLVPPERLTEYLSELCDREDVVVGKGVLPLVVRAGGGSVRDSLSVLDQLMAGAGDDGVDYERAVALLGYTHASLLDDVADAFAAGDGASVFRVVDRVIESGHDPRRFVEDLLERFRDLIVIAADPDGAAGILRATPADQLERMRIQARNFGAGELSRAADVVNSGLTEMTGATSPRLQLELICARVLLPGSDEAERGTRARVDRLERRFGLTPGSPAGPVSQPPASSAPAPAAPVSTPPVAPVSEPPRQSTPIPDAGDSGPVPDAPEPAAPEPTAPEPTSAEPDLPEPEEQEPEEQEPEMPTPSPDEAGAPAEPESQGAPAHGVPGGQGVPGQGTPPQGAPEATAPTPNQPTEPDQQPQQTPQQSGPVSPQAGGAPAEVETLRRAWPDVMDRLARIRRGSWALVSQNAQVHDFTDGVLTLEFSTQGLADAFSRGQYALHVKEAISQAIGIPCEIRAEAPGGAAGSGPKAGSSSGAAPDPSGIDWPDIGPPIPRRSAPAPAPAHGSTQAAGPASPNPSSGSAAYSPDPGPGVDSEFDSVPADAPGPPPDWAVAGDAPSPSADAGSPDDASGAADAPGPATASAPAAGSAATDDSSPPTGSNVVYPQFGRGTDGERSTGERSADGQRSTDGEHTVDGQQGAGPQDAGGQQAGGSRQPGDAPARPASRGTTGAGRADETNADEASDDDPDQESSGLFGTAVVEKILGGVVIDEVEE